MKLRLIHLALLLSVALLLLSGCSAKIIAVEELPEIAVTAGTSFDTLQPLRCRRLEGSGAGAVHSVLQG